jgi:MFS family permease
MSERGTQSSGSGAAQILDGWRVITGSALGVGASYAAVAFLSFGVFIQPLSEEFGWGRGYISIAITVANLVLAVAAPLVGRFVDRVGAKRVLFPSMVLWAVSFASLSLLTGSLVQFYAVFLLSGVLGLGSSTLIYTRAIAAWFDRSRGLALGLAMSGVSVAGVAIPPATQGLVDAFGWRMAYSALGLVVIATVPLVALLLRESWEPADQASRSPGDGAAGTGPVRTVAKRSRTFYLIAGAAALAAMGIHGITIHLIPLLVDRGTPAATAALVASLLGAGMLVSRIACGYLMDRFFAPWVTIAFFLGPTTALALLYAETTGPLILLCALLLGMGSGAEVDAIAYLTSRYFRLQEFGEQYGWFYGCFMLGSSLGPLLMGFGFDQTGSYQLPLLGSLVVLAAACGLLALIEPYPEPASADGL